jgi:hypothetical protein
MAPEERLEEEAEKMHMKLKLKHGGYCQFDSDIREHFMGTGDSSCLFR